MSLGFMTLVIFLSLLVLLLIGFPIAFCLMSVAVVGYLVFVGPSALATIVHTSFANITNEIFVAIPLFIFMATVLQFSGLATALYDMMYKWFAGLRGGLAIGTIAICTLIAAMTGIGATGTITMGLLAYPEMRQRGYDKGMAIGSIPFGGALGPLIPPSVTMILVGGFGTISIGKLFISGIFPGVIIAVLGMIYVAIRCLFNPELGPAIPLTERANWRQKFISLRGSILPIILIILVLGGIYNGVFTPSEAGGIGAFGALICAAIYGKLNLKNLKEATATTLRVNAMVLWIVIGGASFSALCGLVGVKEFIGGTLIGLPISSMGIVIIMLIIVFIMGMFIDPTALVMITVPIFIPIIRELGFDPLWFGLLLTIDVLIGYITPPFGINLFYFKGLGHSDVTIMDIYRSVVPYVVAMVIGFILCVAFPEIALWLPNMMIE